MSYSTELKKTLKEISTKKKCCRYAFFLGENLVLPDDKRSDDFDLSKFVSSDSDGACKIKFDSFKCQSCKYAFIRGVFCSCGTVSNPEKSFHLEIKIKNMQIYDLINEYITENCIEMKKTTRNGSYSLYLKKADDIEDFMHFMGADKHAFEFANEKIKRDFINRANRQNNFEVVNINKTVTAAGDTIQAIHRLQKKGVFNNLSSGLKETAKLRIENPYANLEELAEMHNDRITKSGVNHRLKRLMDLADSL